MKIYNGSGVEIVDVRPDDSSHRYRAIMGDNNLTLKYSLAEHIEIPIGSYVTFQGQQYTLKRPEALKMQHTRSFEYTVIFESPQADSKIWKFRNTVDGRLKFPMTATPREHLQMFVDNMNSREAGWSIGQCIEGEEKLITYDHDYCWDALGKMAQEFGTEFEIVNKAVSLCRVERFKSQPLALSYGKGNGFRSGIGRSNDGDRPPVEILFCQGGTDNIDPSKYGSRELHLPKNGVLRYDGAHFQGEAGYVSSSARVYVADADGLSIRRSDKALSSQAEDSIDLTHIYPKRIGVVSSVITVDAENHFYDFTDTSIPSTLDYDACLIEGEAMTVEFQTGMLAGHGEFEVKYYHQSVQVREGTQTITKAAKRFEIVPKEEDGYTMPDNTFKPVAGDKYAVFHCQLPQAYINDSNSKTGAEWDMFREAVRFMYNNEEALFSFMGELDGLWAKNDWANVGGHIVLGGYISFTDARFQTQPILVRITGVKDFVNRPHSPEVELSNKTVSPSFITTIKQIEAQEVLIDEAERHALSFTKRRWRDAKETLDMLNELMEAGFDNFTSAINPITVQTMAMLVGDESLQFRFVNRKTAPISEVPSYVSYDQQTKVLTIPATILQHLTLGIDSVKASHTASEYKFWDVSAYTSATLDDGTKKYYLYVRANRSNSNAVFLLSETAHRIDEGSTYYWFLVGILNSEYEDERSFASLYGFTEVLPGRITTNKILSPDGNTYFDLVLGEIGGCIKIKAGSSGMENLDEWAQLQNDLGDLNDAIGDVDEAVSDLNTYVDGAFADGIISESEAVAIQKYINTINNNKAAINATYTALYGNAYLSGTPKTNLYNKKAALITAITNLTNAINTAIADGKATPAEKADVDDKFSLYNTAMSDFNQAVENAVKAIEDYLKGLTDNVAADLTVANGKITANASSINTINNTISTAGWITQGDGNTWWAKKELEDGNTIISYINQTATTTTISSSKINLVGAVTFSMFSTSLQNTINGKANTSDLGSLASKDSIVWNDLANALKTVINGKADWDDLGDLAELDNVSYSDLAQALKNTIDGKASTNSLGSLAFLSSVSASELATALKNTIDGKANSSSLGTLAGKSSVTFQDLAQALQSLINSKLEEDDLDDDIIQFSRLGSTIVEGGYIKTALLNVIKIAAVEGTIAGLNISNSSITSTTGAYDGGSSASALSSTQFHLYAQGNSNAYLGYSGSNVRAEIGLNTYNGSSSTKIMCDLRDTKSEAYVYTKIGLYVDIYDTYNAEELSYNSSVTSNIGATAIYINRGHVTGLKRHLRHISGNNTAYMNKDDSLVHFHNTSQITAYLPTGCEDGQEIWVLPYNTTVKVKTSSGYIHRGENNSETEVDCSGSQYHIFIYCAYNGRWIFGYLNT